MSVIEDVVPGFLEKLLIVDLTSREVEVADSPEELARKFLDGRGGSPGKLQELGLEQP